MPEAVASKIKSTFSSLRALRLTGEGGMMGTQVGCTTESRQEDCGKKATSVKIVSVNFLDEMMGEGRLESNVSQKGLSLKRKEVPALEKCYSIPELTQRLPTHW